MKKTFKLEGLDCAHCAGKIEAAVQKLPGVTAATLNFMAQKLSIEAEAENMAAVVEGALAIVAKIEPDVVVKKA